MSGFGCTLAARKTECIVTTINKFNMAKESSVKENAVVDALRRLKEEELELVAKLKPIQEAIGALEKIVDKSVKKVKTSNSKESANDNGTAEEIAEEVGAEA
jgi:hypothetical protein